MKTIKLSAANLEDLAVALAEGEHGLGNHATAAGHTLVQWPGVDCPWFVPHPEHLGGAIEVARFDGFDIEGGF